MLAGLQPAPSELLGNALSNLRREVEFGPLPMLPRLAHDAMSLTDMICWVALEQGDVSGFCRYADTAVALQASGAQSAYFPTAPGAESDRSCARYGWKARK